MIISPTMQFATGFSTLAASLGRSPWVFEPGAVDLSLLDTHKAAIERLVRGLGESAPDVRLPGQGPQSGSPQRVALRDVPDIAALLAQPGEPHLPTRCTTRSAARTSWRTPGLSAAPTRALRAWTVRTSRMLRRTACSGGSANWRLRSGERHTDRTPSEECSYRKPTASSGRWASRPCGIGYA